MREAELSDRLGTVLEGIRVPETVAAAIVASLRAQLENADTERQQKIAETRQRLAAVRSRMDRIYGTSLIFQRAQNEECRRTAALSGKSHIVPWPPAKKMAEYREGFTSSRHSELLSADRNSESFQ